MSKPLKVLLIEDSEQDAELITHQLERGGWEVTAERVETPEAMTAALDSSRFDLLISDYRMPRFSAPEALAVWKARGLEMPFLVVSGTIGEEHAVEVLKAGAHDFFLKDKLSRFCSAVERELRESESRRTLQRAERALEDSERYFRSLIENAGDIITVLDSGGRIRYVSPAAERVLGHPIAELVGKPVFELIHPDDHAEAMEKLALHRAVPETPQPGEFRFRHRDGSYRVLQTNGHALRTASGGTDLVVNARDVTEHRLLEEQLRQAQKMEAVGRLAGGIAHDFNNLLTAVLGHSELALLKMRDGDPLRHDLEEIRNAGERAANLTRQLLTFSRKQVVLPRVLDLGSVVTSIAKLLRQLIGEDIELVTVVEPGSGNVRADRGHLEQILVNLSVNARDAMPNGGRLTVEVANFKHDQATPQPEIGPGRHMMIAVTDTGTGMDAETRRHLFEPFFTTKEHGTGLGLATVYGIVQQSGGAIAVQSEPGAGTTLKVYLPRVDGELTSREPAREDGELPRGTETVLLLEDDDMVRRMVQRILGSSGYRVLAQSTADEAEATLRTASGEVALVVTDVVMPRMSGREAVERLRALRPDLRVLYMSGYTDDIILHSGYLEPGVDFLQKPFSPASLAKKVREVLDRPPHTTPIA